LYGFVKSVGIQRIRSSIALATIMSLIRTWGAIMNFRTRGMRALVFGLFATAGLALAPAAFAHGGVSIGINVPGLSIGVGPHHHGYIGIGGPAYYHAPAYYAPAAYDDYYYDYGPVYGGAYYYGPRYRHSYHGGYYHGYHGGGHYYGGDGRHHHR